MLLQLLDFPVKLLKDLTLLRNGLLRGLGVLLDDWLVGDL